MSKRMVENSIETIKSPQAEKGHIAIHILITFFGISTWIGINGVFVQLPVLINISPEGWKLPVYLVLVIQSANIGPIIYTLLQYFRYKLNPITCILSLLTTGTVAMILLVFFHAETTIIGGTEYSLALFILIFISALVGCFSSVLFMPYLHNFNNIYIVSYFIGEGLSGVLPSIVALPQGVDAAECDKDITNYATDQSVPGLKFSSADYFIFLSVILLLSLSSFIILEYSPFVRKRRNLTISIAVPEETEINHKSQNKSDVGPTGVYSDNVEAVEYSLERRHSIIKEILTERIIEKQLPKRFRIYLFFLLGIFCFFGNGILPSIQSYSCLPYGNLAYKLSIALSQIANPIACFVGIWFMARSVKIINILVCISIFFGSYVSYTALESPNPPWQHLDFGLVAVIFSWTVLIGVISYVKMLIVSAFKDTASPKLLFNVGAVMQAGSAIGAVVSFLIINYTNLFTMYDSCA